MTDYIAPAKDVLFALKVLGFNKVMQLSTFTECTQDLVETVVEESGKFAEEVMAPLNQVGDKSACQIKEGEVHTPEGFKQAYQQFIDSAWLSLSQDPKYAGQGMPFTLHMVVTEFWNAANVAMALNPMLTAGAIDVFKEHANEELKHVYLPKLVSGQWTGTMNLTESHAGSDLSSLKTKASSAYSAQLGAHYLIKGQKIFITWGNHDMAENIVHLVLAPVEGAPSGVKGLSLFAVPKFLIEPTGELGERNDINVVSIEHKLGIHASPTCVMSFGENKGAVGYMIGESGQGLSCMFTLMNHARLEVGLEGAAISQRAYQAALGYARQRVQGKHPKTNNPTAIIAHADVQRMLLTMKSLTDAMRLVCLDASISHDMRHHADEPQHKQYHNRRFALLTPIVKAWCTELVNEVTSLCIQVHGGMGYIEETGVAQYYRDARITSIYEGTTGIQANDLINRKLIRDKGASIQELFDAMESSLDTLTNHHGNMAVFIHAKKQLQKTAEYILSKTSQSSESSSIFTGLVAYDFLMQCGYVCGAWYHLRQYDCAQIESCKSNIDKRHCQHIETLTDFYLTHILPRAQSHANTILSSYDLSGKIDERCLDY